MRNDLWAVVVCGGSGERMGGGINKTLLPVAGVPSVVRVVKAFRACDASIALVVKPSEKPLFVETLARFGEKADAYADAGTDRQESAYHGLQSLPPETSFVLVHDGARGLVTQELIRRVTDSVVLYGSGVAALPVTDTVKMANKRGIVLKTLDRSTLYAVQTPQGFCYRVIMDAHEKAKGNAVRATDDAALMEAQGVEIHLVTGDKRNIKLTTPEDVQLAVAYFERRLRVGHGYDAHKLEKGRRLVLGGVLIPYDLGLMGHSDADVALHALMDALLGAAALGDIGKNFPDSDEAYRGISSLALLGKTARILDAHGFCAQSVDLTIVAQCPKLAPFIQDMREQIACTLALPVDCVSVKATTTEGMGFEGRGEGISAHAIATVLQLQDI